MRLGAVVHATPMLGAVLVIGLTIAALVKLEDPALVRGTFSTTDRRRQRLGDLSYAQTARLVARLRDRAAGAGPVKRRAEACAKLAQIYRQRRMAADAAHWLQRGLALAPRHEQLLREQRLLLDDDFSSTPPPLDPDAPRQ